MNLGMHKKCHPHSVLEKVVILDEMKNGNVWSGGWPSFEMYGTNFCWNTINYLNLRCTNGWRLG